MWWLWNSCGPSKAEAYNGTGNVWTTVANMTYALFDHSGGGPSSNSTIMFGGTNASSGNPEGETIFYDGISNTWTGSIATMNILRSRMGGVGNQTDALGFGGQTTSASSAATERFHGAPVSYNRNLRDSMNDLQHINSILTPEDSQKLAAIKDEISDAWHKRQIFRTETEARFAVLNDFKYPTRAAKYWQAVREQTGHFDALVGLSFELRRKKIKLEQVEDNIKRYTKTVARESEDPTNEQSYSHFKRELKLQEVERDELLYGIASAEQVAKDRVREIMQWSTLKAEINDGSFDDKDVNTHQRESLFRVALNHAQVTTPDASSEEKLSIKGLIHGLQKEKVNVDLISASKKIKPSVE